MKLLLFMVIYLCLGCSLAAAKVVVLEASTPRQKIVIQSKIKKKHRIKTDKPIKLSSSGRTFLMMGGIFTFLALGSSLLVALAPFLWIIFLSICITLSLIGLACLVIGIGCWIRDVKKARKLRKKTS